MKKVVVTIIIAISMLLVTFIGCQTTRPNLSMSSYSTRSSVSSLNTEQSMSGTSTISSASSLEESSSEDINSSDSLSDESTSSFSSSSSKSISNSNSSSNTNSSFVSTYTITWEPNGGTWDDKTTTVKTTSVVYNGMPTAPGTLTKAGYTFSGWTPAILEVTGDITYTASWTINYKVNIVVAEGQTSWGTLLSENTGNGTNSRSIEVTSGTEISYIFESNKLIITKFDGEVHNIVATPTSSTQQYTYAFKELKVGEEVLDKNTTITVTEDITITAYFTQTVNKYSVTIKSGNSTFGKIVQNGTSVANSKTITMDYGTEILYNSVTNVLTIGNYEFTPMPVASTAQYIYSFVEWDITSGIVTGETTITAIFSSKIISCTISLDVQGTTTEPAYLDNSYKTDTGYGVSYQ